MKNLVPTSHRSNVRLTLRPSGSSVFRPKVLWYFGTSVPHSVPYNVSINPTAGSGYRQRTTKKRQWISWGCKGMFREVNNYHTETPRIPAGTLSVPCGHHPQQAT